MLNLVIALAVGSFFAVAVKLAHFSLWAGIVPGVIAFIVAYLLLARRISQKVQLLMNEVQKELSVQPANARDRQARVDRSVKMLESGLVYERWQFLVGPEIHAQIGMIKYMFKDLDGAAVHFAKASPRNYMALAMKAALQYQRKQFEPMKATFEAAVKSGKKEAIVWAAYAWCLQSLKDKDGALRVLARAVELNPSDAKLKSGLTALQNDKKLKMKPYEPLWWQFGLENPPLEMGGGRQVRFSRR